MKLLVSNLILFLFACTQAIAQSSGAGQSPYSDEKFDPPANVAWYTDPLTVGGIILVVGIIVLYIWKKK